MFDIEGPIQDPASGQAPTSAVIFLHGYGADGNDLIGLAPFFATALPGAVFHSPHAPEPCEIAPFGRQWFSLGDYDPKQSATFQLLLPHIRAAAYLFDDYIDGVMAHYGLTADRVALVGFSQGTMMALHVALRRKTPLAAVVGFSGALIGSEVLAQEITARPPVKLIHGEEDEVVPFAEEWEKHELFPREVIGKMGRLYRPQNSGSDG